MAEKPRSQAIRIGDTNQPNEVRTTLLQVNQKFASEASRIGTEFENQKIEIDQKVQDVLAELQKIIDSKPIFVGGLYETPTEDGSFVNAHDGYCISIGGSSIDWNPAAIPVAADVDITDSFMILHGSTVNYATFETVREELFTKPLVKNNTVGDFGTLMTSGAPNNSIGTLDTIIGFINLNLTDTRTALNSVNDRLNQVIDALDANDITKKRNN